MMFCRSLSEKLKDHIDGCEKRYQSMQNSQEAKHEENQSAINAVAQAVKDLATETQNNYNKNLRWIITILLTIIGWIAAHSLNIHLTTG